ncbi:pyridoxamine 5'-phosphate oxidase [Actinomadura sp. NBRC 104412]|uniref:pyridoxamine 5'-phosphate oxidase n=1 Tax=Actinomadura sp. NBRC 104412 TaxID=3032203 RepID=UPI0025543565|nr:pyridoxamine 5'-phosphate oxidase [Actinomadura sp. NBRC 104412]
MEKPTPDPAGLRKTYEGGELVEEALPADPLEMFAAWFADAAGLAALPEPNAMVLATASARAVPSVRTVLLKGYGPDGFRFFTNLTSRKGRELAENPRAALVFPWHSMHRQVIVNGPVERLSREETAAYFRTRPYGSRLGAWASERQSAVISGRAELEERWAELARRWPDPATAPGAAPEDGAGEDAVPLPDFWGGFRVVPETVEFWQGRPNRLHDRLRYRCVPPGTPGRGAIWKVERLSP